MACGGFVCSKTSLCILNLIYVMVSLLMIGVAAWGKWFGLVSSFRVMAAVIAVGLFLFVVAIMGLCGAVKHHQVLLFFYMLILFMVFIVQFSVSCACLAINKEQQNLLLEIGWNKSESMQQDLEISLNCCDFLEVNYNESCVAVRTIIQLFNPRLMIVKCLLLPELNVKNIMLLERQFELLEQIVGILFLYIKMLGSFIIRLP
uniref:Tetraspanin 13a n=1 Tax=Cyprinus carpio TaxID=7962 RepID=A0A8C1VTK7_CYPCA